MEEAKKFNAVMTDGKKPYFTEVEGRELKENEVLVKVEAAPINPSDQYYTVGSYGIQELLNEPPTGCGFEGAGTVVDAHESVGKDIVGKKVSFFQDCHSKAFTGTWRQYIILHKSAAIVFPDEVDVDKIASSLVNPLTVIAMIDYLKKRNQKAIVHSAACSNLGKMLVQYCKKHDVPLVNIVRREEQVKILEELGAENIVNSSLDSFQDDLKAAVEKVGADCFYDAIGGDFTTQVLDCMPPDSIAYVYGGLSGKSITISPLKLIFYQRTISYLWLTPWFKSVDEETRNNAVGEIIQDLATGGKIFGSDVVKTVPLSDFEKAIELANKHASEGKVILKPHES